MPLAVGETQIANLWRQALESLITKHPQLACRVTRDRPQHACYPEPQERAEI